MIPIQEVMTIAIKQTDEFFFRYLVLEQLHSDQGCQFESELIVEVYKLLKVSKSHTPHIILNLMDWLKGTTEHA